MSNSAIVHVGYPKTGSTWLQHSVLAVSEGLFVVDRERAMNQLIDPGRLAFDAASVRKDLLGEAPDRAQVVLSHEWLVGHPHLHGYDTEVFAERIRDVFGGEARILVVIRRQTDLLGALYGEWVGQGGSLGLSKYLAVPGEARWHPGFRYDFYEYDRVIRLYRRLFGRERVVVAPYELLLRDPDEYLDTLRLQLDLPQLQSAGNRTIHRSLSPASSGILRQLNRVVSKWDHNPSALVLSPGLHGRLARTLRRCDARVPDGFRSVGVRRTRDKIERSIHGRYGASNRRVQHLTGLDLGSLGYDLS